MADINQLIQLAIMDAERQSASLISDLKTRKTEEVIITRREGKGSINEAFYLDSSKSKCKLIFIRATFNANGESPPYSTATFRIFQISTAKEEFNSQLHRVTERGPNSDGDDDVFIRIEQESSRDPSPWTVQKGSGFNVKWVSPNPAYKWALEVGLARAR